MTSDQTSRHLILRNICLLVSISVMAWFLIQGWLIYALVPAVFICYQLLKNYRRQLKVHRELQNFVAAVHYRDFSLHFDISQAPEDLKPLRTGFNQINHTFKQISREKETQHQYLKKILELIDTGILSYQPENGDVLWVNESLKKLLHIPYLKTIAFLQHRDQKLYKEIISLKPGESKIYSIHTEKKVLKVLLSATAFQTGSVNFKLIAFQNINEALDETETKAWQKLLSVLTHEIMNSIAPISSLAGTLKTKLSVLDKSGLDFQSVDDLEIGIDTIQRRSQGLLRFAETYRNLNKITEPVLEELPVKTLFQNLQQLMQPTFLQKNIELELVLTEPRLTVTADIALIEQVMINLLLNAITALKDQEKARIIISAERTSDGKIAIQVADNGCGIPEDLLDNVFVPFFSTKKTGGGIGLTLCKQIMMLHQGQIQLHSTVGTGTSFTLFL